MGFVIEILIAYEGGNIAYISSINALMTCLAALMPSSSVTPCAINSFDDCTKDGTSRTGTLRNKVIVKPIRELQCNSGKFLLVLW